MESITTAALVTALIFKAVDKSGETIGEALTSKISQLINVVREKFKANKVKGILVQAQEIPTETNKQMFKSVLEMQISQDKEFEKTLRSLMDEIQTFDQAKQMFLKDIDVSGDAEIGDIIQNKTSSRSVNQEAAVNLKVGGSLKIGNVNQQG